MWCSLIRFVKGMLNGRHIRGYTLLSPPGACSTYKKSSLNLGPSCFSFNGPVETDFLVTVEGPGVVMELTATFETFSK